MHTSLLRFGLLLCISMGIVFPTAIMAQEVNVIFLPLTADDVQGAFGSRWSTEHYLTNVGNRTVDYLPMPCVLSLCDRNHIDPGQTVRLPSSLGLNYLTLLFDRAEDLDFVTAVTLVREESSSLRTRPSQIRALRRSEFREVVHIPRVPVQSSDRLTLRLLKIGSGIETKATVRIWRPADNHIFPLIPQNHDELLAELEVPIRRSVRVDDFAMVVPAILSADAIRVEVIDRQSKAIWVMITATDNQSNQVSIFTP